MFVSSCSQMRSTRQPAVRRVRVSAEPMDEPAARLRAALADEPERLLAVSVGETFRVPIKV